MNLHRYRAVFTGGDSSIYYFDVTTWLFMGPCLLFALAKVINGLKVVDEPGQAFKYASGDTQMLAMVIEKATGTKIQ
mgnify:CR=1 FL=1